MTDKYSLPAHRGWVPQWTALCYPLGRAATGRVAHIYDAGKALWLSYVRVLAAVLPPLAVINLWGLPRCWWLWIRPCGSLLVSQPAWGWLWS